MLTSLWLYRRILPFNEPSTLYTLALPENKDYEYLRQNCTHLAGVKEGGTEMAGPFFSEAHL